MELVRLSLDCFNSRDGTGLFAGVARYAVLQDRVMLSATQSRSLFQFWGTLCRRMQWPTPPKRADGDILAALTHEDEAGVLAVLAGNPGPVIQLARLLHSEHKRSYAEPAEVKQEETFSDSLEGI